MQYLKLKYLFLLKLSVVLLVQFGCSDANQHGSRNGFSGNKVKTTELKKPKSFEASRQSAEEESDNSRQIIVEKDLSEIAPQTVEEDNIDKNQNTNDSMDRGRFSVLKNGLKYFAELIPGFTRAYGSELPAKSLKCNKGHYLSGIDTNGGPICEPVIVVNTTNNETSTETHKMTIDDFIIKHVVKSGGSTIEACCQSNQLLVGCSGARQPNVVDTCSEEDCAYIGTIVSGGGQCCKSGADLDRNTAATAVAFCLEVKN